MNSGNGGNGNGDVCDDNGDLGISDNDNNARNDGDGNESDYGLR